MHNAMFYHSFSFKLLVKKSMKLAAVT